MGKRDTGANCEQRLRRAPLDVNDCTRAPPVFRAQASGGVAVWRVEQDLHVSDLVIESRYRNPLTAEIVEVFDRTQTRSEARRECSI